MSRISATRHLLIGGSLLVLLVGGGSAIALAAPSDNVYQGCLSSTGDVHNVQVNPGTAPTCQQGEKQIAWNQTGPAGPQGPAGQVTSVTESSSFSFPGGSGQAFPVAECPSGTHPTGGGYMLHNGGAVQGEKEQNIEIVGEAPAAYSGNSEAGGYSTIQSGGSATAWGVLVNFQPASTGSITVYAQCVG